MQSAPGFGRGRRAPGGRPESPFDRTHRGDAGDVRASLSNTSLSPKRRSIRHIVQRARISRHPPQNVLSENSGSNRTRRGSLLSFTALQEERGPKEQLESVRERESTVLGEPPLIQRKTHIHLTGLLYGPVLQAPVLLKSTMWFISGCADCLSLTLTSRVSNCFVGILPVCLCFKI